MKMRLFCLLMIFAFVFAGCGSKPSYQSTIQVPEKFTAGQEIPMTLIVKQDNQPATGLVVTATLEMKKMDHGTVEVAFTEQGNGEYVANVVLPMGGEWIAVTQLKKGNESVEQEIRFSIEGAQPQSSAAHTDVVATVNGETITVEDIYFYQVINRIQIALMLEKDLAKYSGVEKESVKKLWETREQEALHPNSLLTQVIRLRAMAMLGKEKGHQASELEVAKEIEKVKAEYTANPKVQALIKEYGDKQFWSKQKSQYQRIVVVNKVQQDIIAKVKEANPKAGMKEVNMLAQKKYEELLVSQVGSLQINIVKKTTS
ncbi:FixH family protein [Brevibacillus sp. SYSU BS000544]|uniref:FixH family protein n=1 Tax=Brevibacillus sp. SYSU BS000544 TaxID=3416443 RepID=UPI003CE5BECE